MNDRCKLLDVQENLVEKAKREAEHEVVNFLERLPLEMPYSEMARACLARFDRDRTWSLPRIAEYWKAWHPCGIGRISPIDIDPDLREFIDDRFGRFTFDALAKACCESFGEKRAPSRSSIQRYAERNREQGVPRKIRMQADKPVPRDPRKSRMIPE